MLSRRFDRFAAVCALATGVSSFWIIGDDAGMPTHALLDALFPWSPFPVGLIAKAIVLPFALAALCLRLRRYDALVGWIVAALAWVAQIVAAVGWSAVMWFPDELHALDYPFDTDPMDESSPWFDPAMMTVLYSEMMVGPIAIFVLSLLAWRAEARLRWLWPLGAACGPAAVVYATAMLTEWSLPEPMWSIVSIVEGGLISAWYVALAVIVLRTPRAVPSGAADAGPADESIAST